MLRACSRLVHRRGEDLVSPTSLLASRRPLSNSTIINSNATQSRKRATDIRAELDQSTTKTDGADAPSDPEKNALELQETIVVPSPTPPTRTPLVPVDELIALETMTALPKVESEMKEVELVDSDKTSVDTLI